MVSITLSGFVIFVHTFSGFTFCHEDDSSPDPRGEARPPWICGEAGMDNDIAILAPCGSSAPVHLIHLSLPH